MRWIAAGVLCLLVACRDTPVAFAPAGATDAARANADGLFTAFEQRFTNVQRTPRYAVARTKMAHDALTPSRVIDDTTFWNGGDPATDQRSITVRGTFADNHYTLTDDPAAGLPTRLGDSRQFIALTRRGKGEYEWTTRVAGAIGSITADDLARVIGSLIAAPVTRDEPELRAEIHAAFPRTADAMGRLFSIDTLHVQPGADSTARVTLVVGIHPDQLTATYPAFAKYVRKYVTSSRWRTLVLDRQNERWLDIRGTGPSITIVFRGTRTGCLAPFGGPLRAMPDTLTLKAEFYAKFAIFSVGMSDLESDLTIVHRPHERGWNLEFRREPHWHFPLAMEHLMRGAMRYPFEGTGAALRLAVRDSAGAPSLLLRDGHLAVKESTVMKWLGGAGSAAAGDFAGQSEREENQFDAEVFAAMRSDLNTLLH